MRKFNLEGLFTYLSELFAGHPSSGFAAGSSIPTKQIAPLPSSDPFDVENLFSDMENDQGGFLSSEMVTRRGAYDRHFLA